MLLDEISVSKWCYVNTGTTERRILGKRKLRSILRLIAGRKPFDGGLQDVIEEPGVTQPGVLPASVETWRAKVKSVMSASIRKEDVRLQARVVVAGETRRRRCVWRSLARAMTPPSIGV